MSTAVRLWMTPSGNRLPMILLCYNTCPGINQSHKCRSLFLKCKQEGKVIFIMKSIKRFNFASHCASGLGISQMLHRAVEAIYLTAIIMNFAKVNRYSGEDVLNRVVQTVSKLVDEFWEELAARQAAPEVSCDRSTQFVYQQSKEMTEGEFKRMNPFKSR